MSLIRIVLAVTLGLASVSLGVAQSPSAPPAGAKKEGASQPRANDVANRAGGSKRAQPTQQPAASGEPQTSDAEDARLNRILNGICRGC